MAYNPYDELITGHPKIRYYWTLDNTPNATVGGVNFTGTTTYGTGIVHTNCATFDGTSEMLTTASGLSLSNTDKITIVAFLKAITYDTTNVDIMLEYSSDSLNVNGGVGYYMSGNVANDPVRILTKTAGGVNQPQYFIGTTSLDDNNWHFIAITIDNTLGATEEKKYYEDAILLTPDNFVNANDSTGNFGDLNMNIGGREGGSLYSNIAVDGLAIFDDVLTFTELQRINAAVVGTMPPAKYSNIGLQTYLKTGG